MKIKLIIDRDVRLGDCDRLYYNYKTKVPQQQI